MKAEELLAKRVANYLQVTYPTVPYHYDFGADVKMTMGTAKKRKELMGRWSKGHPDLTIYTPNGAVFIELKATKKVPKSKHTDIQKAYHALLRKNGFVVDFCCGYEETIKFIDKHLKGYA